MKKESIRSVLAFTGGIFLVLYLHFVPILPARETSVHLDDRALFPTNLPLPDSNPLVISTIKKNQYSLAKPEVQTTLQPSR